jgi:hypothetical protein
VHHRAQFENDFLELHVQNVVKDLRVQNSGFSTFNEMATMAMQNYV